jgi:aspartyl-tRNA(Asn)/glutamyl-tRNA(Gln) amidotransferase subunit A
LKREQARNDIASSLEGFDAVLTPTTPITAIPVEDVDENAVPLARFTRFVNYLGLCALSLPAGLDGDGMPISVQLIGRPDSESRLLNIGFACEKARGAFPLPDLAGFES